MNPLKNSAKNFLKKDTTIAHVLKITNLEAGIGDKKILRGVNLEIKSGEIHVIMGPNGSGKSTLLNVLMGHPKYEVLGGSANFDGRDILEMEPTERSHLGLFLAFQHPLEIPGVTFGNFMRISVNAHRKMMAGGDDTLSVDGDVLPAGRHGLTAGSKTKNVELKPIGPAEFAGTMKKAIEGLGMDAKFMGRPLNEGFSGGEKKRAEIVQMSILKPKIALLDEIDSGLDIDALKAVSQAVMQAYRETGAGILLVTHYQRILDHITPDYVHVMSDGRIVKSGGGELAHELEENGYGKYVNTQNI